MSPSKSSLPKEDKKFRQLAGISTSARKKDQGSPEFVAPDGGWGWMVVVACGLSNFSTLPLVQNFGLVYKEKFEEWGINQAEYSFMRNLEFTVSSCTGLISGVLLKKYGFRKMSFIGGCFSTLSILITSQIKSISLFTIFYAVIGGISTGILWPSNALAINTYFKRRRGVATGFSWTITGLSPVLMPQLISLLMDYTDAHGTVLVLASIALHSIPFSLLLQPVHWHTKRILPESKRQQEGGDRGEAQEPFLEEKDHEVHIELSSFKPALKNVKEVEEDKDGGDNVCTGSVDGVSPENNLSSRLSIRNDTEQNHTETEKHSEECKDILEPFVSEVVGDEKLKAFQNKDEKEEATPKSVWRRYISFIVDYFDLTIMKDPEFIVIFIGMTLAFAAEVNFVLFMPFVFAEFGYEINTVALFMSVLASIDLVTRFTLPIVTDKLKLDARMCYTVGLTVLGTGRIVLAHFRSFNVILVATVWLGFGKGIRTVYMALVIPSYVPLERLPTASGLQMLANGFIFMTIGPIFGYLRDRTGNYTLLLHSINVLTFTTVVLWVVDMLVKCCRRRSRKEDFDLKKESTTSDCQQN